MSSRQESDETFAHAEPPTESDRDLSQAVADTLLDGHPAATGSSRPSPALRVLGDEASQLEAQPRPLDFAQRYTVDRLLGQGGMGTVTLCHDQQIGRDVALKTLRADVRPVAGVQARFLREARMQGQLEHPAVAPVYDLGVDDEGAPFFTMKRVRGETLTTLLHAEAGEGSDATSAAASRRLLSAFASVCLAIDYAHRRGVLHRDLKPDNIMLGDFGEVYVLDWGVATLMSNAAASRPTVLPETGDSHETRQGVILGTPGYIAPERLEAPELPARPASDVYALGAILFEILARRRLNEGRSAEARVVATLRGAEPEARLRALRPTLDPELAAICGRAAAADPAVRYADARQLADALERYLDGERDQDRRRALAQEHATQAERSARIALASPTAFDERQAAMRSLGRALALDPECRLARDLLVQLLALAPRELPEEVQQQITHAEADRYRQSARVAAHAFAAQLLMLPVLLVVGVRDWSILGVFFLLMACCSALSFYSVSRARTHLPFVMATVLLSNLAFACVTVIAGPLILGPTLITVNTLAYVVVLRGAARAAAMVTGCAAVVVPLLLEFSGLGGAYAPAGAGLTILPGVVPLGPGVLAALVGLITAFALFVGALAVTPIRDLLLQRERQLFVYAWHLREFLPEQARPSDRS